MGRPTNAEIAAKKAAEEEKSKADALAQKIAGTVSNDSGLDPTADSEKPQDDNVDVEDPIDLSEDKPDPVTEPVKDMPESNITAPTFEAEYVIYDHMVKAHGKFYAAGEKVPVY